MVNKSFLPEIICIDLGRNTLHIVVMTAVPVHDDSFVLLLTVPSGVIVFSVGL